MLLTTLVLVVFTLLTWPFTLVYRWIRIGNPYKNAQARRVVVLGLDGMDPGLVTKWMREGRLPNFAKLAEKGVFRPLDTSNPSISPVAWSTFATGVDASRHAHLRLPDARPVHLRADALVDGHPGGEARR